MVSIPRVGVGLAGLVTALVALTSGVAQAMPVPGVDTSHYQHTPSLNWQAVRADGVRFAFLKASEGSSFTDPKFAADWRATAAAGIVRGAYHFARPAPGTADSQARHFASVIGPQKDPGTLPPVLDLEVTGGLGVTSLRAWTHEFLTQVEQLTGRTPMIYVSPAFWESAMGNSTAFHHYPLWIANWDTNAPRVPGGWPTWTFWQTTSKGRVSGISGAVDRDLFNGSVAQLKTLALTARPRTNLTLSASSTAPLTGERVVFQGVLHDVGGHPIPNRPIVLREGDAGSRPTKVAAATTATDGSYSMSLRVTTAGDFTARFPGGDLYRASRSPAVSVTLTPRSTSVTMTPSATSVPAGQQVTFSGVLRPAKRLAGRTVTISVVPDGEQDAIAVATAVTDATGNYEVTAPLTRSGSYRADFVGDAAYTSATSPDVSIAVAPNPTALRLSARDEAVYRDRYDILRGRLVSEGAPVSGRHIVVSRADPSSRSYRPVTTVTTDEAGRYRIRVRVQAAGKYRASFAGEALYQSATTPHVRITIIPPGGSGTTP